MTAPFRVPRLRVPAFQGFEVRGFRSSGVSKGCTVRCSATIGAVLLVGGLAVALGSDAGQAAAVRQALASALVFHASFDGGVDARRAADDPKLYWAPTWARRAEAQPGLPPAGDTRQAPGEGRFGDALRFTRRGVPPVFYHGGKNMPYAAANWNGAVSFWLSTDPQNDLGVGFCDPIQITPRAWNNGAFFVEFEKGKGPEAVPFRLGVYADFDVWNPTKRPFDQIPPAERPLTTVDNPPFAKGKWTHIVFTWESFNTGRADGVARLYLDGQPRGTLAGRQQTFTWDPAETKIALGLGYIGLMDDVAVFNRRLSDAEIAELYRLERGAAMLAP